MTTFVTIITAMYTLQQPDPNYVVNVLWQVTGINGNYTATVQGSTPFSSADQVGAFIPYDQLTEATVIGWIPVDAIASAQATVQGQIDVYITPPVSPAAQPLPWA